MITTAADKRQERALEQKSNYVVFPTFGTEDVWTVQKLYGPDAGTYYDVCPSRGLCTCPDSTERLKGTARCKHSYLVMDFIIQQEKEAAQWGEFSFSPEADDYTERMNRDFPLD